MPKFFWYGSLVVAALLILGYTLWKTRDLRLLVLHFCLAGLIDPLEYVILILLPSYQYYSGVMGNPWIDNMLGSFASNDFIVPSIAVAAAAFKLRFIWLLCLSILFMGIEWLFLSLQAYVHYWWTTIYTGIGILLFFWIAQWIWGSVRDGKVTKPILFVYTFFAYLFLYGTSHFIQGHFMDVHELQVGWFPDPTQDHIAIGELLEASTALIAAFSFFLKVPGKVGFMAILLAFDFLLLASSIIQIDDAWEFIFYVLLQLVWILGVHAIVRYGTRKKAC
ncbi:hypothetical protein [Brevibacillus centrosporus]|uniref:hypothetical protein n=1 Tax=Brevibacillus centrosporus TaxID=54910 RepID=UPI002E1DD025|nr:hypothetical protein [Brevibacillus centrosporus]